MVEKLSLAQTVAQLENMVGQVVSLQNEAYNLRQEAIAKTRESEQLVTKAKQIETAIFDFAVENLGEKQGRLAYSLVSSEYSDFLAEQIVVTGDKSEQHKIELYGVSILQKYEDEAHALINGVKAGDYTDNPYAKDRGKNAWRRMLFEAVQSELGVANKEAPTSNPSPTEKSEQLENIAYNAETAHYKDFPQESSANLNPAPQIEEVQEPVQAEVKPTPKLPSFLTDF